MKKRDPKEQYRKRQKAKKSAKTVGLIALMAFLITATLAAIVFYFYTKETMGELTYPKSPLTKTMNTNYSYVADDSIPVLIKCPSIPVLMNVGGTERYISEAGAVYIYGNDLYISIYETQDTSYGILSGRFVPDLYAGEVSGDVIFDSALSDVGYFNGYPAEYQSGDCQIIGSSTGKPIRDIYALCMVMDLGLDKKVMIIVSTSNKRKLYDAGVLLQSIGYTVMDTSKTNYIEEEDSSGQDYFVPDTGTLGLSGTETVSPMETDANKTAVSDYETTDAEPAMPLPVQAETDWKDYTCQVNESYGRSVIVFEYANSFITPRDAILYSPDGTATYTPDYWNDGNEGVLRFVIPDPQIGLWTIKVDTDEDLGTYKTYCMDYETYSPSLGENSMNVPVSDDEVSESPAVSAAVLQ